MDADPASLDLWAVFLEAARPGKLAGRPVIRILEHFVIGRMLFIHTSWFLEKVGTLAAALYTPFLSYIKNCLQLPP
ncbi:hypothetical protein C7T94_15680 [Pedobacter yulinensis]|uniref:Uncharacterized protein n=1 Tax=Pedobacter yulinensis TaxID=2126353 RepID=A0A2T3HIG0_9SPHI|nr:hypothetical protein [Pedobacter yulinensis]PST82235.1 hypothetical protein C7T94_15680 [Pedobacter yulinensis]